MAAPMVLRGGAVDACIERFSGRALKWGVVDCAKIVGHNLRQLGISTSLIKGLKYDSEMGAAKALRSLGVKGLGEAMDRLPGVFPIPPAMATKGDVIGFECDGNLWDMALTVAADGGQVFGIHAGQAVTFSPDMTHALAAWRCNPCRR